MNPTNTLSDLGEAVWPLYLRDPHVMLFGGISAAVASAAFSYGDPKKIHYPFVGFAIGAFMPISIPVLMCLTVHDCYKKLTFK